MATVKKTAPAKRNAAPATPPAHTPRHPKLEEFKQEVHKIVQTAWDEIFNQAKLHLKKSIISEPGIGKKLGDALHDELLKVHANGVEGQPDTAAEASKQIKADFNTILKK